ncbi:NIF family HAD-type phosphatase [Piscinibacter gummiphilus]|uniref:Uncharacterized protein n=1 Tax=Piscinibacter gummiphilus TaxID=946333 RepID=A0A1W6LD29_9BURK|nr:NIF family HAD-type phosphatase [Piscinibacter gummiphilus]ARN22139.1 hypothetical protein A4W93_20780 [Piscinibacter gummiphilus]ATU66825.1 hypothetical protein CPZ87_20870 [Piscinibacter gummiphilus]GLS94226.1 hypothetical protein GCM10007918_15180 [Piscinibacter gummiphilus]
MKIQRPKVLALDLEGTLISNAMSQIPRPGLFDFLSRCQELFPRVVMFTTVKEPLFRDIAALLVAEGAAPAWFGDVEYVAWHGETKDLNFVPSADPSEVILVDDFEKYVHPGQASRWLQIDYFDYPYDDTDEGLAKTLGRLEILAREA